MKKFLCVFVCTFLLAALAVPVLAEPKTVFWVNEYAFDFAANPGAPEIARSICGTRCNALSETYNSFKMPGGWRLVKVHSNKRIVIDIDNPFVKGNCICIGDEYLVTQDIPLPGAAK